MVYITNAFSLQMIPSDSDGMGLDFIKVSPDEAKVVLASNEWQSAIGHADTAAVVSDILGQPIPVNRINVTIGPGDTLLVAQLTGGRLPEGATKLPDGFKIQFFTVVES